jgi:hypothetical protein
MDLLDAVTRRTFDLLLLDWVMPEMAGDAVLEELRKRPGLDLPVIVVTARDGEADVVGALRLGADDYIVKPAKGMELLARIEALSRRSRAGRSTPLRAGRFEIDASRREFEVAGRVFHEPRFATASGRAQLAPTPLPDLALPDPQHFGGLALGERGLVLSLITARSYGQHNTVVYKPGDSDRGMLGVICAGQRRHADASHSNLHCPDAHAKLLREPSRRRGRPHRLKKFFVLHFASGH